MIEAGLSPTDPARWWLAYVVEQAEREQNQQQHQESGNIKVVDDESPTL